MLQDSCRRSKTAALMSQVQQVVMDMTLMKGQNNRNQKLRTTSQDLIKKS